MEHQPKTAPPDTPAAPARPALKIADADLKVENDGLREALSRSEATIEELRATLARQQDLYRAVMEGHDRDLERKDVDAARIATQLAAQVNRNQTLTRQRDGAVAARDDLRDTVAREVLPGAGSVSEKDIRKGLQRLVRERDSFRRKAIEFKRFTASRRWRASSLVADALRRPGRHSLRLPLDLLKLLRRG